MDLYKLARATKASQDKFELWQLLILLDHFGPARILEIGVHRGGLVETMRQAFPHATVVGIDKDLGPLEFTDFIAVSGSSQDPNVRDEAMQHFARHMIDFLFIDGDHNYDGVKKDFELYGPLVKPGGIIAFHDIQRDPVRVPHHAGVDCRLFFDQIKQKYPNIEIWNGPAGDNGPGIGVIFV